MVLGEAAPRIEVRAYLKINQGRGIGLGSKLLSLTAHFRFEENYDNGFNGGQTTPA